MSALPSHVATTSMSRRRRPIVPPADSPSDDEAPLNNDEEIDYVEPPRPPLFPTSARPGSISKLRIMRDRVKEGESPFHPNDAKFDRRDGNDE